VRKSGEKPTVVIADDESHVRTYIRALATRVNLEVVGEASDGEQAIALYHLHQPDLLLLDVNMPLKTGEQVLKEVRDEFPHAKVIMLSSVADRESVETCLDLGAAHYIRKDCPPEEIQSIIRKTMESA
jgi:two-component system chemotaxis response regulator CheY